MIRSISSSEIYRERKENGREVKEVSESRKRQTKWKTDKEKQRHRPIEWQTNIEGEEQKEGERWIVQVRETESKTEGDKHTDEIECKGESEGGNKWEKNNIMARKIEKGRKSEREIERWK